LTDTESRYSLFDWELLAAFAAICHFHHFYEGRSLQLWTDHKPLVTAFSRVSVPIFPRQQHHLAFISEFSLQILYLQGLKNVVADFFVSPFPTPLESAETVAASEAADPINLKAMAAEQNCCAETQRLLRSSSLQLIFLLSRRSTPRWQCFNRHLLPICPRKIQKIHFFPFAQHFTSWEARLLAYGIF
jgi:hypothetical protein